MKQKLVNEKKTDENENGNELGSDYHQRWPERVGGRIAVAADAVGQTFQAARSAPDAAAQPGLVASQHHSHVSMETTRITQ